MMRLRALLKDRVGTAAAEMAMVAPMLLILMFGATELGRFFWNEHQLVKSVRDATTYLSRQQIITSNFDCGSNSVGSEITDDAKALIRTGVLADGTDRMPNWNDEGASIEVTLTCVTSAGGTNLSGIYSGNANTVPLVTVTATLPYDMILKGFGLRGTYTLQAKEQAAVMGV